MVHESYKIAILDVSDGGESSETHSLIFYIDSNNHAQTSGYPHLVNDWGIVSFNGYHDHHQYYRHLPSPTHVIVIVISTHQHYKITITITFVLPDHQKNIVSLSSSL